MVFYLRKRIAELPREVGYDTPEGARLPDGNKGFISRGPYIRLEAGLYCAGFYFRKIDSLKSSKISIEVASNSEVFVSRDVLDRDICYNDLTLALIEFSLASPTSKVEVRCFVGGGAKFELRDLVIFCGE